MIMILNHNIFHKIQSAHQDAGRCSLYQRQTHPHDPVIPFADFLKQCPRLTNHLHNPHNQDDPLNHQNHQNPPHLPFLVTMLLLLILHFIFMFLPSSEEKRCLKDFLDC